MTTPNHIAAGVFFTGFWASFWSINIFSKWEYIAAAVLFSLIPDADHTKSPTGIMFFPIAKWINKKYGHRTITHSLAFHFTGTALLYFICHWLVQSQNYSESIMAFPLIFFFAVMSHLLLDMITVEGVPLFYPVRRNPCVIPGNRDYRLISGKLSSEITALLIFIFMNFLCWDLYQNGFWTNYNTIFTTIQHMHFERAGNPNFTLAKYDFVKNGKKYNGKALILNSTETSCQLLINDTIYKLDYNTPGLVINSIIAEKTTVPFTVTSKAFISAPLEDIRQFITGQVVSGNVSSDNYFTAHFTETQKVTNNINFDWDNHIFIIPAPPKKPTDKSALIKQLAVKKQTLAQQKINFEKQNSEYYKLVNQKNQLQRKVDAVSIDNQNPEALLEKNTIENELIKVNNKLLLMNAPVYTENIVTLEEIKQLQIQINKPDTISNQTFTANLSIMNIPSHLKSIK